MLNPNLVEYIEKGYCLSKVSRILPAPDSYRTQNYILDSPNNKFFLKKLVYQDTDRIEDIVSSENFFSANNVPAVVALKLNTGNYYFGYQGSFYMMYNYIEAFKYSPKTLVLKAAYESGQILGKMHYISSNSKINFNTKSSYPNNKLFNETIRLINSSNTYKNPSTKEEHEIVKIVNEKEKLVAKINSMHIFKNTNIIHGDYHLNNILFNSDRIIGVVDFEKTELGSPLFELIRAIFYICFENEYNDRSFNNAYEFLLGYKKHINISQNDLIRGIDEFLNIKILNLWREKMYFIEERKNVLDFIINDIKLIHYLCNYRSEFNSKISYVFN